MAEEINMTEESVENPNVETADSSAETPITERPISSLETIASNYKELPAKPESIDIYKYVVGNPVTGSNPMNKYVPERSNPAISLDALKNKTLSDNKNYEYMRPYTYNGDFDGANFERYYNSKPYKTLGFSPYRDNESLYNDKMTLGDEFVRAASQWPALVWTGFKSGVTSWGDMFTDPLAPDIEGAREMKRIMERGSSSRGGVGGFLVNTFLNSGYTVGIGLDILAEDLALMAVTGLTGGLASEATLPAMFTRTAKGAEKIVEGAKIADKVVDASKTAGKTTEAFKATDTFRSIDNINDARNFWNTGVGKAVSATGRVLNPLENTLQAVKATDYATDYAKVVGTFGAFARDVMMTKAAVAEAKLEGGMTKIDTTEDLIKLYREEHDTDPSGEDLQKIENLANQQAHKTALWNLPAIMWSNKFMYETMLAPVDKLVKPNAAKFFDDIVFDNKTFVKAGKGFLDKTKMAAKALKQPKVYGKYGWDYVKGNLAEGVQENLQEAIASASAEQAKALYKDPARADYEGYFGYFMKGLDDQFSAQGAETFASGFAMSLFASPIMGIPSRAVSKTLDLFNKDAVTKAKEAKDAQRTQEVNSLNKFYGNILNYFAPDLNNAVKQQKMSDDLYEALENNDVKTARDIKDESIFEHIHTALETGKYDIFLKKLKDYKNLSPEEAKDAFKQYGIEDGSKALKYIDKVIQRAENIKQNYEMTANEMPNPFNYKQYNPKNDLYAPTLLSYRAWEEAKKKLIFGRQSLQNVADRMEKMTQEFSGIANKIAKSEAQTFLSFMSPQAAFNEINILKGEIQALDTEIPAQAKVKKDKEKKLELVQNFYDTVTKMKFAKTEEEKDNFISESKKNFNKFLNYIAGENKEMLIDTEVNKAFQIVLDNMSLSDEAKGLVKAVNVLSNPEGFLAVQKRMANVYSELFDDMENTLAYNNNVFAGRNDLNFLLNEIYKRSGLILKPEDLKKFRDAVENNKPVPSINTLYDQEKEQEVSKDDERFKKVANIFDGLFPKTKEEEEKPKAKITTEEGAGIILGEVSTYPQDLLDKLDEKRKSLIANDALSPDTTLDEFISESPIANNIVSKYIKEAQKAEKKDTYAAVTTEQLQARYEELVNKENKTDEEEVELKSVENALAIRKLSDKLTPEQSAALDKLKQVSKDAKKKDDQTGYKIQGEDYNLRVTKLKDQILQEVYNVPAFDIEGVENVKPVFELFDKALKDLSLKAKYPSEYADNLVNYVVDNLKVKGLKSLTNKLTDKKVTALKAALTESPTTLRETFKKVLGDVFYQESRDVGNELDSVARDFFEGNPIKKPTKMTQTAFNGLYDTLYEVRKKLQERGEIVIASGVVPFGRYNVKGTEQKVAGELDLLVIDKDGKFKIYDIKTSQNWNKFGKPEDKNRKKEAYGLQLSIYKTMLEDMLGIEVTSLALIPIGVSYDDNARITEVRPEFKKEYAEVTYDKVVEDYLQPLITSKINWNNLINKAVSEKELDTVIDQMDKVGAMTPDFLMTINKKRESIKSKAPVTPSTGFVPREVEGRLDLVSKFGMDQAIVDKMTTPEVLAEYNAKLKALEGKPAEETVISTLTFAQPADVEVFNQKSIPEKFKELITELKGDNQLEGTYAIGEYMNYENQSYEITLDDGRVVRTTPFREGNVTPLGQKVVLKKTNMEIDGKMRNVIGVYRIVDNIVKEKPFTYVRENIIKTEEDKSNLTLEDMNKNINKFSLEAAKVQGYEVLYAPEKNSQPSRYSISKIAGDNVTLEGLGDKVIVPVSDIKNKIVAIIDPSTSNITEEDKDQIINNQKAIVKPETSYNNNVSEEDAANNFLDKLC